jgi:BASS family bile acid:Na+ symporter
MVALMFAMGLTLGPGDFRRIALLPLPTVVGSVLQLVGMPLAGMGLAHAFGLEPALAAGLVIMAACPGGLLSNVVCHLGKADTALSITLTATATVATLLTIPLWVRAILASLGHASSLPEMPVLDTTVTLAGLTVVPVVAGMLVRPVRPGLVAHEPWITRASTAAVVLGLTADALRSNDPPLAALTASWPPALLLVGAAAGMGLGVPLLLRLGWREAATIAVELCIKNGVLGLYVATQSLGSLEAGAPIAVVMTVQLPVALGVLALCRTLHWRRVGGTTARDS